MDKRTKPDKVMPNTKSANAEIISDNLAEIEAPFTGIEDPIVTIRRTRNIRRRKALVDWTQISANILVPLAIIVAATGLYFDRVQSNRDASSRHIELFYSESLTFAQLTLFKLWQGQDLSILRNALSRKFVNQFVSRRIEASGIERDAVNSSIISITSYFDSAEVCIASGRCDESELLNHVGAYGRDFFCFYAGQIQELQNVNLINYLGDGLQEFAGRAGGCHAKVDLDGGNHK